MFLYSYVKDCNSWIDEFGLAGGDYKQIPGQAGHQKHHIIPQSMKHPLLDDIGYDAHQSKNIIQLPTKTEFDPTKTVHRGKHKADYDKMIASRLDEIHNLDASKAVKKMHVDAFMDDVGDDLRNKRIRLNNAH